MSVVTPSPEQQDILDLGLTSVRIRAGAGTGKTTTVALIIANLVDNHGVDPEQVLGITFTNKAAAELAERVRAVLGPGVDPGRQVEVHTYHGFAAQVLAEFGPLAGVDNRAKVITPTFARQLIAETFHHTSYDHLDMTQTRTLNGIRQLGDRLGDHLLGPQDLIEAALVHDDEVWAARVEMAKTLAGYEADKRRLRVVDYSDLVTLATRVAREHPGLAAEIAGRYRVVVLDEYQDTNPAQRVLLGSIFSPGFPVIAVGDEDQTIYEWRGASPENFEMFPTQFPTGDGAPAHDRGLTLNRRSAQDILDIANQVRERANPGADPLTAADPAATGEVHTYWARDALAEADWIARRFEALHESGSRWRDMAVLLRKNRDFSAVIDAMSRHDIPVEVANVGGLLSVPEIAEIRAWLTALERPEDSAAITQILFGSRYRLGMADLAPLTRWVAGASDQDDADDPAPITLIEAIEAADRIDGMRPEARAALGRFRSVYREVLTESQGLALVETCRLILDRTRAWQDIEALPPNPRLTARLNIYRLLDLAEDWSPLKGRPSVGAFLDYLATMEDEPADELDSARLSGEDAVTLVTIHRAKGLEWETVAIPAVVKDGFPGKAHQYPDPARFPAFVPIAMRIDSVLDDLSPDTGERTDQLRERHLTQEWRVAYVAVTRAKRRLLVSGAHWYGLPEPSKRAKEPSELFDLVASHPVSVDEGRAELTERPEVLRHADPPDSPDPLFPDGWAGALAAAMRDPESLGALASEKGVETGFREELETATARLFKLSEPATVEPDEQRPTLSVTGLVTYAQCPKRFYWAEIDRLPRRRSTAAIRGTEVHRRIELDQRGQVPFEEMEADLYDLAPDEGPTGEAGGFRAYEGSRFARERALLVEAQISFSLDSGHTVRGRIDAVYGDETRWEVVDFKSGRRSDDPSRLVQLQAYAVAVRQVDLGLPEPERLDVTFAYLGGGLDTETHHADETWIRQARERVSEIGDGIAEGRFEATPGAWCGHCDFLRFCGPGKAWVGE